MHTVWEYGKILPLDIDQKSLWISNHFDIVHSFFVPDFFATFVPKCLFENFSNYLKALMTLELKMC